MVASVLGRALVTQLLQVDLFGSVAFSLTSQHACRISGLLFIRHSFVPNKVAGTVHKCAQGSPSRPKDLHRDHGFSPCG